MTKYENTYNISQLVKENKESTSLNYYMEKNNVKFAIRISANNFGFSNGIKSVPLYAAFCIKEN